MLTTDGLNMSCCFCYMYYVSIRAQDEKSLVYANQTSQHVILRRFSISQEETPPVCP